MIYNINKKINYFKYGLGEDYNSNIDYSDLNSIIHSYVCNPKFDTVMSQFENYIREFNHEFNYNNYYFKYKAYNLDGMGEYYISYDIIVMSPCRIGLHFAKMFFLNIIHGSNLLRDT
jgi:hypothetical protein